MSTFMKPGIEDFKILAESCKGELLTDRVSKLIYSTDASIYREEPLAVFYPADTDDLRRLLSFARKHHTPVIPRAAGTSLAGQVVGSGIIADMSRHFCRILEINEEERWVRVEPGVVPDELNIMLKNRGLMFGPETSTANRCNIGGMIGNNGCGLHSVVYGSVRDHIIDLKALLYDGSEVTFMALSGEEIREKASRTDTEGRIYKAIDKMLSDRKNIDAIKSDYPSERVPRRNTAYALDDLAASRPYAPGSDRQMNLARLITGSEGTLAIVTEARLRLVPLPPPVKALSCVHLSHRNEAFPANLIALRHKPWAVELMDDRILNLAEGLESQKRNMFFIQGRPGALLFVEFCGDDMNEVETMASDMVREMRQQGLGYAYPLVWNDDIRRVWNLRKAGLGILSNMPGDAKPVTLIEDCALPVESLGDFVGEIETILKGYGKDSVFHAHIGSGELHIRPVINIKDSNEVELMRSIGQKTALLVKKYRGSLSGEHGDGRLRGEFIPLIIGEHNYQLNRQIKEAFDPAGILNPGKIIDTPPMDSSLRYIPGQGTAAYTTFYDFTREGGIVRAAEKCNGSGDCRKSAVIGGVMCPTYMATGEERLTTRARANITRELLSSPSGDPWNSRELYEMLDLCIACKGCSSECPSGVDIAKIRSEFLFQYHERHRPSLRTLLIAGFPSVYSFFAAIPSLFNFFATNRLTSLLIKKITGFATQRSIPSLSSLSLRKWLSAHLDEINPQNNSGELCLFIDEFTDHNDTHIGISAVKLLTSLGYRIIVTENAYSARTYISKGFLRKARSLIRKNIDLFYPVVNDDRPLVGIEPSALLGFRDEYPDLAGDEYRERAVKLSHNALLLEEFLAREFRAGRIRRDQFTDSRRLILVHAHCQEKSVVTSAPLLEALSIPEGFEVREIPSGCCGMAGAFGFEKEHFDLSVKIGEMVLFPAIRNAEEDTVVVAPGTSCRHHIKDGTGRIALHPAELLEQSLKKAGRI